MIIQHGQVALADCPDAQGVDIRIEEGRIVEIGEGLSGTPLLDARGLYVLPGGIDPHVHLNDPGYTHRESFGHGSRAAAAGGITTVIDMPCTSIPPVTNRHNLMRKLAAIAPQSVVDFALYGGVSGQGWEEDRGRGMEELAADVVGFKAYLISGMASFGRLNHYQLEQVLLHAKALGRPLLLHAEDYDYVTAATEAWMGRGDTPVHFYHSRPEIAELLAIRVATEIARSTEADLHIVHIGTAAGVGCLDGSRVTGETAPHYLAFDLDDFQRIGAPLKATPPVKSAGNRDALWALLAADKIDFVASDHAPCPAAEKNTGSVWTDYSGIPGTGTLLPFMFSEGYMKGRLTLARLAEVTATSAARRYRLDDRKGSIAVGKDADLVLIDPRQTWTVEGKAFYSRGKITPFEGTTWQGRVVKTILRGQVIYDAAQGIRVPGGYGQLLRPRQ